MVTGRSITLISRPNSGMSKDVSYCKCDPPVKAVYFKLLIPLALTDALTAHTAIIRRPHLWELEVQLH